MSPGPVEIIGHDRLGPDERAEVLALLERAAAVDGIVPVDEHVRLALRTGVGDDAATHLLARLPGGELAGYAHLDRPEDGPTAELTVHPEARRRRVGSGLLAELERAADGADAGAVLDPDVPSPGTLRVWSHGELPGVAEWAADAGYERTRALLQLHRRLRSDDGTPIDLGGYELPEGVVLRGFRVGSDEDAWLKVNATAFAEHPEQGAWTTADLSARQGESWFDPAGFLLAERVADGTLLGFHWTKVHTDGPEPIGEIYVLGVGAAASGLHLGSALTIAGLIHLQDKGLPAVMLYVDESNDRAVQLYRRFGFEHWRSDATYQRPRRSVHL